jgi:hypothetical protein
MPSAALMTQRIYGTPVKILFHRKSGLIVLHMLNLFNIITEAHWKAGQMMGKKTKQMAKKTYKSVTEDLVRAYYCN